MTVSTEISSNEYTGNGVTTDFDYKFRIFKANQLSVITSDADGDNVVMLRLGTDYTVTGANKSAGGKVILTKPLANGHKISIARDIPITQETSFRNQSKFFAETHEDAFDYLTMIIQRIWGSLGSLYLKRPNILSNWFDAKGYRIANLGKPKRDSDAVDLGTLKDEISGVNSTILKREKRLLRVEDMDIAALPKASERAGNVLTFDKDGKPNVVAPASGSAVDVLNQLSIGNGSLIGIGNGTLKDAIYWVTPEMFGAVGDGVEDDTSALVSMIKHLNNYPDSGTPLEIEKVVNGSGGEVRLTPNKVYRYTSTLFVPSNVRIESRKLYFNSEIFGALFYDGDINLPAVTTLTYKKDSGGTYQIYNDTNYLPQGSEFDNGTYYAACRNVQLNCSVITKPMTKVGVYWIGAAGSTTNQLCIGENKNTNPRMPIVGFLQTCAWGSVHYNPHILATANGAHFENANGGTMLVSPYVDRNGSNGTELESSPYKIDGAIGSYGISSKNTTVVILNPVVEHFWLPFIADNSDLRLYSPHIESYGGKSKHCYYAANESKLLIDNPTFFHDTTISDGSVFYVNNQHKRVSSITCRGMPESTGYTLIRGDNSDDVLKVDDLPVGQWQFGKIGDSKLVQNIGLKLNLNQILVSQNGDDDNYGLHAETPVKTVQKALELSNVYGFDSVIISVSDAVIADSNIDISNNKEITFGGGGSLNLSTFRIVANSGRHHSLTNNIKIISTSSALIELGEMTDMSFKSLNDAKSSYSLFLVDGFNNINISISGGSYMGMNYLVDSKIKPRPSANMRGMASVPRNQLPAEIAVTGVGSSSFIFGY
ncbi:hypothetical protein [Providencia alcalifaciens]|uniref:hypothetical protein n=1 Tax=Providencia alcalifaciens TaxID=126385 RepID=UPI0012B60E01|nr:hypothetical protein [Providencia alcalifaciens]MTC29107.1 hypothetical protein [Providencia alcalifaciens]MTC64202.1 hypothetical protein [Providencia alcalifaciens]WGZ54043.1 hypothetical protein PO864_17695 [Providencia alcalifaciens]